MRWLLTVLCLTTLCGPQPARAARTVTFPAVADTYVDAGAPTTNFDPETRLRTDASPERIIYLRFEVSGTGGQVLHARLRLGVTDASSGSGGTVHVISDHTWAEHTLTFGSRPPVDGPGVATLGPTPTGAPAEFNLDGVIIADGIYDLALDNVSTDGIDYRSRTATKGPKPELVLTLAGGAEPAVTIVEPREGTAFLVGDGVTLSGNATDAAGDDLGAEIAWNSSLDGPLGIGVTLAVTSLSAGFHRLTASVTDRDGLGGQDSVSVSIVPPGATVVFPAAADTYVDESVPTGVFGRAEKLKIDGAPRRETFLRFELTGVPPAIAEARLRLTAGSSSSATSGSGGTLYGVSETGWREDTTTFVTRPVMDGPLLDTQGSVFPGAVFDFDVTGAVVGTDTYAFGLRTALSDGTEYRSREASSGRPQLIVTLRGPADDGPVIAIGAPANGTIVPFGEPLLLRGTASDPQDGDLSALLEWTSSIDGALGSGAELSRILAPGAHTITALVTDRDLNRRAATTGVFVSMPEVGFEGFSYGSGIETSTNRATAEKPESKLWYADGSWWATLFSRSAAAHRIHRLDPVTQRWLDTGVAVDERPASRQDVLWEEAEQKLYVVSRFAGPPAQHRLLRYSYLPDARSFVLDPGFPVVIPGGAVETLTVARDGTGTLWVAYVSKRQVFVNRTVGDGTQWGVPFVVPFAEGARVGRDDVAAVQALPGAIGVFWNSHATSTFYFAVHADGLPATEPAAWRLEIAAHGSNIADDHVNLKLASDGRLFAAVKTDRTNPASILIGLLVRSPAGAWSPLHRVVNVELDATRPQCLIDEVSRVVYVFYSAKNAAVFYKASDLDTIAFPAGVGTPVLATSAPGVEINNPTTTKQRVDPSTGVVVLGSTADTHRYWHNVLGP